MNEVTVPVAPPIQRTHGPRPQFLSYQPPTHFLFTRNQSLTYQSYSPCPKLSLPLGKIPLLTTTLGLQTSLAHPQIPH